MFKTTSTREAVSAIKASSVELLLVYALGCNSNKHLIAAMRDECY